MHFATLRYLLKVFTVGVTAGRNKTKGVEIIRNDNEVRIALYGARTLDLRSVMRNLKRTNDARVKKYVCTLYGHPCVDTLFVRDFSNTETSLTKPEIANFFDGKGRDVDRHVLGSNVYFTVHHCNS